MPGALAGFNVVDLTNTPAGALATLLLVDHGANVVRVIDREAADFRAGSFTVWDRGKRACRIDLEQVLLDDSTAAGTAFTNLLATADVCVHDFAPADSRNQLVDATALRLSNPGLTICAITAYGKHGPWRDEPAIDELVLARTGVLSGMPGFRPPPVHVVHPLPSVGAAVLAALGIAAALYATIRDGHGRDVATSLMAGALLYHPKVTSEHLQKRPFQTHPAGSAPFYSVYQCGDERWLQLGCVHLAFIATAARVLGIEEQLAEPQFDSGRPEEDSEAELALRNILTNVLAQQPYQYWADAFEQADVPFAESRWTEDSFADPQVRHNHMFVPIDDPVEGIVEQLGIGLTLTVTPGKIPSPRSAPSKPNRLPPDWPTQRRKLPTTAARTPLTAPLAGTRILEITNLIAGPTAGRLLAELGADVVKFEPLTGDMSRPIGRSYFYSVNFNKRSISVNSSTTAGKQVVQRIAQQADAMVANLRPDATERMGITPALNPRLLEVHLTGYGWTGPYAKRPGIDPLAQALMGLQRAQGGPFNAPVFPAQLAPTDFTTGAIGAFGTVLCLLERERNGTVQRAESNLLNGAILLCSEWFTKYASRAQRPLADREQLGLAPHHRLYQTANGWLYLVASDATAQAEFYRLFKLQPPEFVAAHDTHANETTLAKQLTAEFLQDTTESWLRKLKHLGLAAAPVAGADSEVFLHDSHALDNGVVAQSEHPTAGAMRVVWRYIQFANTQLSHGLSTPLLGQHSHAILAEVGFQPAEIEQLYADGIVKTATDGF